jgi:hypothetical protein
MPYAIFEPSGRFDGGINSPKSVEEAQRLLARPRRWATLAREGWTVREVTREEFIRLADERIADDRPGEVMA